MATMLSITLRFSTIEVLTIVVMEHSEPLGQPLLNADGNGATEESGHLNQGSLLPATEAPAMARNSSRSTKRTNRIQLAGRLDEYSQTAPARSRNNLKRQLEVANPMRGRGWTTETCSYITSVLALAGLVATLLAHQNRPLPQWPQLVTINSIISLFSLLMRACVGVVLAEGTLFSHG